MAIDGWEPDADAIDFDEPKKDATAELYGEDIGSESAEDFTEPQQPFEATDEDNALTAVIDIGLDMVEGISADIGYPKPNRTIWENHGKKAMNKAVNTLCPAGTGGGNVINSPWIGLIIGIGCLFMCLYPLISYKLKQKEAAGKVDSGKEQQKVEEAKRTPTKPMDNAAPPIPAKLPGGGDEAMPTVPMSELIRRNLESGGDPTPI